MASLEEVISPLKHSLGEEFLAERRFDTSQERVSMVEPPTTNVEAVEDGPHPRRKTSPLWLL